MQAHMGVEILRWCVWDSQFHHKVIPFMRFLKYHYYYDNYVNEQSILPMSLDIVFSQQQICKKLDRC